MADAGTGTRLLQFARCPVPGRVKTRMLPALTPEAACDLHSELVREVCTGLLAARLGAVELWVEGAQDHPLFQECLALGASDVRPQQGADLGERMQHALADGLCRAQQVLLVGSDCPGMDRDYLMQAAAALNSHDLVLGPALDGGYVLIGCRCRLPPTLFQDMPWGTSAVLELTRCRAADRGLKVAELRGLRDIDRPEDLAWWRASR